MVVVLANCDDETAQTFARHYRSRAVRLLTPPDLSLPGWSYSPGQVQTSQAVVSGRRVPARRIAGVITRLAAVREQDIPHIQETDRAYVAAEMNAFLLAWLTELPCPILNRPAPSCLAGRWWCHEQWIQAAHQLGIPVAPIHHDAAHGGSHRIPGSARSRAVTVTLVGQQHFGCQDAVTLARARALARAAGVEFLEVCFTSPGRIGAFVGATLWPDVMAPIIAGGLFQYFQDTQLSLEGPMRRS